MLRTANAFHIGPLTLYRWSKGPTASIECFSHSQGTTLEVGVTRRYSVHLVLPIFRVPDYKSRIRARRYYR